MKVGFRTGFGSKALRIFRIFIKFKLIVGNAQDPRFSTGLKIAKRHTAGSGKIGVNILTYTLVCLLGLSFVLPFVAQADFLSFVSGLFQTTKVEADSQTVNSQNMALLEAHLSPHRGLSVASTTIAFDDTGTSLLSGSPNSPISGDYSAPGDQISIYVVHQGDTLPAIAKMFGVSVNTIRWANNISGNTISVGETLVIMPMSGIEYKVKSGDTLLSIAKMYKGSLQDILQYNNLTSSSKLSVGDVIFIPDAEAPSVISQSNETVGTPNQTQSSGNGSEVSPPVGTHGPSTPLIIGYYMRPILGGVKTQGIHGHNAVDLASSYGTPIMASADGQVIIAREGGWNGGYGSYVAIKHPNGTETLYAHMSKVLVSVGDTVTQGEQIGEMGSTGDSTGNHVHFEIRGAVNPF